MAVLLAIQFLGGFVLMGGALCATDCHEDEVDSCHDSHCKSHFDGLIATAAEDDHDDGAHFGACTGPTCPCHHNPVVEHARTLTIVYEAVDTPHFNIEPLSPGAVLDILHVPLA